jgi:hypothetical protein
MNKPSPPATSTVCPKIDIAKTYLQLQRLRRLVQQAESSQVTQPDLSNAVSRINPQRRHQA